MAEDQAEDVEWEDELNFASWLGSADLTAPKRDDKSKRQLKREKRQRVEAAAALRGEGAGGAAYERGPRASKARTAESATGSGMLPIKNTHGTLTDNTEVDLAKLGKKRRSVVLAEERKAKGLEEGEEEKEEANKKQKKGAAGGKGDKGGKGSGKVGDPNDKSTVFVQQLARTVTNEMLQKRFSEIGPVKNAFVVPTKGGKALPFGYVQLYVAFLLAACCLVLLGGTAALAANIAYNVLWLCLCVLCTINRLRSLVCSLQSPPIQSFSPTSR